MAGRVRQVQDNPAVPRAQPRHELRRVQDHLLVGVGAPAAGARWSARRSCCRSCFFCGAAGSSPASRRGCGRCSALGALLGAVGWWMVSSGLAGRVSVSQYRLALSSDARLRDLCGDPVDRARLDGARGRSQCRRACARRALALLVLVLLQIYLGALVAGLDAGLVYNTWPLIDGASHPVGRAAVVRDAGVAQPVREHADGAVQPPHGGLSAARARARCISSTWRGRAPRVLPLAAALAGAVMLQAAIGIVTLLHQVPLGSRSRTRPAPCWCSRSRRPRRSASR